MGKIMGDIENKLAKGTSMRLAAETRGRLND